MSSAYPHVMSLIGVSLAEQSNHHAATMEALRTATDAAAVRRLTQRAAGYEDRMRECKRAITRLADPDLIG